MPKIAETLANRGLHHTRTLLLTHVIHTETHNFAIIHHTFAGMDAAHHAKKRAYVTLRK